MWLLLSVRVYEVIHIRHFIILSIALATWCTCKAEPLQMNRLSCQCNGVWLLSRGSCSQAQTCPGTMERAPYIAMSQSARTIMTPCH